MVLVHYLAANQCRAPNEALLFVACRPLEQLNLCNVENLDCRIMPDSDDLFDGLQRLAVSLVVSKQLNPGEHHFICL